MSFKINRVYTRTGDDGKTSLVGGERVSKADLRVEVYGDVDELNSALGIVKEVLPATGDELKALVETLQQELFDLGSELATDPQMTYPGMWKAEQRHAEALERLCDKYGAELPELNSFILPGGSLASAHLHLARCIARRAERRLAELIERQGTAVSNKLALVYLNRLSDLLFILARYVLKLENKQAPLWVKEKDRLQPV